MPRLITLPAISGVVKTPCAPILPYAAIPHALLQDRRLIPTDLLVVGTLLRYAQRKAHCWPSVATIAREVGRCERTVQYSLRRLAAAGWVVSHADGNPTGRVLILTWRSVAPGGCNPPAQPDPALPRTPIAPERTGEKKTKMFSLALEKNETEHDPDAAAVARFAALTDDQRAGWRAEATRRFGWCRHAPQTLDLLAAGLASP